MPIDARLLTLTQWLSPSYPLGAFAYSHGLEAAVDRGWVRDAEGLHDWLADVLAEGTGRMDAHWIARAHAASDRQELLCLDAEARAFSPARERLREAQRQGAAFARHTSEIWRIDIPPVLFALGLGHAAGRLNIDRADVTALYLQGFAGNLVAAAQRLMPLGQTAAQDVLARVSPLCLALASSAEPVFSNAFLSDIAAMTHETQPQRLFQS